MNKIKRNNNKTNKKKILISILFLALTLFSILSPLMASKSDNIKANALSAPTNKTIDLNGVRYEYQTSLNELKNNYSFFNYEYTRKFLTIMESEGLVTLYLDAQVNKSINDNQSGNNLGNQLNEIINESIIFTNYNNKKLDTNAIVNYTATPTDRLYENEYDLEGIDNLNNKSLTIDFTKLFNSSYTVPLDGTENLINKDLYTSSLIFSVVYSEIDRDKSNHTEKYLHDTSVVYNYILTRAFNYNFELPKKQGYEIGLIYISFANTNNIAPDNAIFGTAPKIYWETSEQYTREAFLTIDNLQFINNDNANIMTFESDYNYGDMPNTYPYFKGNLLLSETKYDAELVKYLLTEFGAERVVPQGIGKGYFGGYDPTKNITSNIYYKYEFSGLQTGLRYIAVYDDLKTTSPFYSLYTGIPIGDKFWRYNNQNRLLYLESMNDLRMNNEAYTGAGLSAQIDDILYNVSLVGDVNQIEQDDDIKEDFINLLKTSALGTFIGLIIGLIAGAGPLGAIIGGSIGALIGIFPLIIDALQGLVGSSPALSTIYNLFKSVTMLFVDIFDAIINFALSFITNPIVLIIVVVAVLVYIFVIRKFKK